MIRGLRFSVLLILSLSLSAWAAQPETSPAPVFTAGKHYLVLDKQVKVPTSFKPAANKVQVIEFFSYGCPWCFRLEPYMEKWLQAKPSNVEFKRVPVVFRPSWALYARGYHLIEALRLDDKVNQALFEAVQTAKVKNTKELTQFFVGQGVKQQTVTQSLESSPVLDAKLAQDAKILQAFQISRVPTVIVAQKYKTNIGMVAGDNEKFIELIKFLIKQPVQN